MGVASLNSGVGFGRRFGHVACRAIIVGVRAGCERSWSRLRRLLIGMWRMSVAAGREVSGC